MNTLRRPRILLLLIAATAAACALALAACGGGGGSDEDPQKVLDETFSSDKDYSRGVVDISLKFAAEGGEKGSLDASVKGPFQGGGSNAFPQFDFDADVSFEGSGQSAGFKGGLVSTGDAAFVNFQDTDYEVDAPIFSNFKQLFLGLQSQGNDQAQGGLNPAGFMVDLKNEGTEDVEGTDAIHISGSVDFDKLIEQIKSAPGAASPSADQVKQLEALRDSAKKADVDIYSGADDKRLRRIDADIVFEPPADQTGGQNETINAQFSLTFSKLGEAQTISAPTATRPFSELLQKAGVDANSLGSALGGAAGASTGAETGAATPATPALPNNGSANAYLQCLSEAKGEAATRACSEQLK